MSRLKDVCIDCVDAWSLANWWAPVLGYQVRLYSPEDLDALRDAGIERPEDDPSVALDPIDEPGPSFWFIEVPEQKSAKNRVHIDVYSNVDELQARGASVLQRMDRWTVMSDPEGNEFCVFDERSSASCTAGRDMQVVVRPSEPVPEHA